MVNSTRARNPFSPCDCNGPSPGGKRITDGERRIALEPIPVAVGRTCLARCAEMRDDSLVSTVPEIKEAIARLSPQEYCELMAELLPPREDDEWDKQMKVDAEAGRLDFIDREIEQAKREGTLIPLEQILAEDRPRE